MKKIVLAGVVCVMLNVLSGCYSVDSGQSQLVPQTAKPIKVTADFSGRETDVVEKLAETRLSYRNSLESLIAYYRSTGDNMKLTWAENELRALNAMPRYKYVLEAGVAGPELKAQFEIPEADALYTEAVNTDNRAGMFLVVKDENGLRLALEKYNALIRQYPTSDKIDDAAYKAAVIYEYFKDYTIALLYYQRTYQWDAETPYPAKFKAAYILDRIMVRRAEALDLYRQALEEQAMNQNYRDFAKMRIDEITAEEELVETPK